MFSLPLVSLPRSKQQVLSLLFNVSVVARIIVFDDIAHSQLAECGFPNTVAMDVCIAGFFFKLSSQRLTSAI